MKYLLMIMIMIMILFSACGFEIVDTGNRGVKTRYGKVVSESLEEGLYFYNPITSDITELDVRGKNTNYDVACYTRDIQPATIKLGLIVSLNNKEAHLMLKDYGKDWVSKLLPQNVEGVVKTIVGQWDAVDLIANREKAREQMQTMLFDSLKDKYITVIKLDIMNIDYSDTFEQAIERKVVAVQAAIEAQNKTVQVQEESKQTVLSAKAEAESMRIRAQALSQNKNLVEYEAVQKWNGQLPNYLMGNSVPFINLNK